MGGGWWVNNVMENPDQGLPYLVSWVVWVIFSITLHELGHGWAALRQGDRTPVVTGHMTWNPIVHMGVQSLIIFAVIGIAWGAMPVDPSRFRSKYGDLLVSFAGPMINFSLAGVAILLGGLWYGHASGLAESWSINLDYEFADRVYQFFFLGASLNILLAFLNLLPIPPLDGSRMLADVSRTYRSWTMHPQAPLVGLFALLAVFFLASPYLWLISDLVATLGVLIVAFLTGGEL